MNEIDVYNLPADKVFDAMTAQNQYFIARIADADFDGDTELDPTLNKAEILIHRADEIIVQFPQGSFPMGLAKAAVDSTRQLLALYKIKYGVSIQKHMCQCFNAHFDLWYYSGKPIHPPEQFPKKLFESEKELISAIRAANIKVAELQAKANKAHSQPHPTPRKGSGLHGTRTRAMSRQMEDFVTFLLANPISEFGQGKTLGARANQFWMTHQKAFTRMASYSSNRRGYASAKALASAYRTSKN